jgi:hypothetical protein
MVATAVAAYRATACQFKMSKPMSTAGALWGQVYPMRRSDVIKAQAAQPRQALQGILPLASRRARPRTS